eukprot:scaffold9439_cov118-Isochrysis_galbana.AAC.5
MSMCVSVCVEALQETLARTSCSRQCPLCRFPTCPTARGAWLFLVVLVAAAPARCTRLASIAC